MPVAHCKSRVMRRGLIRRDEDRARDWRSISRRQTGYSQPIPKVGIGGSPRFAGPCHPRARRQNQRGFALLLVFLMASIVAIMLYMELPRAAMQKQRDKEEMLIDRGEQYKRAIQLFVNKARRYPADIKDLENFQNQRFLRQRYADPMTGKDEWRLIHIQGGMLTDSKVTKPNAPGGPDQAKTPNGFVGEQVGLGGPQNQGQSGGAANVRDRRRPSEGANANMPGPTPGGGGDGSGGQAPGPAHGPAALCC